AGRDIKDAVGREGVDRLDECPSPARILAERKDSGDTIVGAGDAGEDALRIALDHRGSMTPGWRQIRPVGAPAHPGSSMVCDTRSMPPTTLPASPERTAPDLDDGGAPPTYDL